MKHEQTGRFQYCCALKQTVEDAPIIHIFSTLKLGDALIPELQFHRRTALKLASVGGQVSRDVCRRRASAALPERNELPVCGRLDRQIDRT